MVDGAFFYQDDWKWKPNFTVSYGLRMEGQNRISDHVDWAARLAIAWASRPPGQESAQDRNTRRIWLVLYPLYQSLLRRIVSGRDQRDS